MITTLSILLNILSVLSIILSVKHYKLKNKYKELIEKNKTIENEHALLKKLYESQKTTNNVIKESFNEFILQFTTSIKGFVSGENVQKPQPKYNIDDILTEILENGIDDLDEDKLNFLKNIKNKKQ